MLLFSKATHLHLPWPAWWLPTHTWFGRTNCACAVPREREQNGGRGHCSTSGSGRTARSHTAELGWTSLRQTQKLQRTKRTTARKEAAVIWNSLSIKWNWHCICYIGTHWTIVFGGNLMPNCDLRFLVHFWLNRGILLTSSVRPVCNKITKNFHRAT